ncbi:hypothetical protein H4J46_07110 [Colwellia sp. MB02u-6]|uniref:hypothetical protein n=1 Tax=Colwellia sp. MB02u-6 TaxID=2759824 RepID=UPI0015F5A5A2|nr:hypothetical protein [Colwellia sp. MB02u-6]MBA6327706.1 hypothetical protein [Colwellia sp. MB02u-6]
MAYLFDDKEADEFFILTEQAVSKMLNLNHPLDVTEKRFPNNSEVINYLLENSDLIEKLNSHKLRVAFVIGVLLLGASVVFKKNLASEKFA